MATLSSILAMLGILRWLSGKELVYHCRRHKICELDSWIRKIPWNRKCQPTPVFLPGKSGKRRTEEPGRLQSMGFANSWTQLSEHTCTRK